MSLHNQYHHDIFTDPEIEITEKPVIISLVTQLKEKAETMDTPKHLSVIDLLNQAANEIERLQGIIRENKPKALLKEIWKYQPVYLTEAIEDAQGGL